MEIEEYKIGYIQYVDGSKESIDYIAGQDDSYVRVFAKSGEYMAYSQGHHVWKRIINYIPTTTIRDIYEIADYSQWLVVEDVISINVRDRELK